MSNQRNTRAPRGRPRTPADAVAPRETIPTDVGRVLSHLAHMIDGAIEARGARVEPRDFAARTLGVPSDALTLDAHQLSPLDAALAGVLLAELVETFPGGAVIGADADSSPVWRTLATDGEGIRAAVEIHAAFAAGTVHDVAVVIGIEQHWQDTRMTVYSAATQPARGLLEKLLGDGRAGTNPFRGKVVVAQLVERRSLSLEIAADMAGDRNDVILAEEIWQSLDRNVAAVFRNADHLARSGLAANRGVLLHGPPGVGKSAAVRAIAAELAGDVTVVIADGAAIAMAADRLYSVVADLAPALVIIDDFDRVVPSEGDGLQRLLAALDGVVAAAPGVVTIATANRIDHIDPAVRRASRIDAEIEIELPSLQQRRDILARYLAAVDQDVDVIAVARLTESATGADLRDLVTEAVLAADGEAIATQDLTRLVRNRFAPTGLGLYM